jgi:hypothetical protein
MTRSMRTKILFKAGFEPANHMMAKTSPNSMMTDHQPSTRTDPQACPFCECPDETQEHCALECPAFEIIRQHTMATLSQIIGPNNFQEWTRLPIRRSLHILLNDQTWGKARAQDVDRLVQSYLTDLMRARVGRIQPTHCTTPTGTAGARALGRCHCGTVEGKLDPPCLTRLMTACACQRACPPPSGTLLQSIHNM